MSGTPNADQVVAEDQFVDFMLNPDEREMRLIGPGGTGKSWTVKRLITQAMEDYRANCRALGLEPEYEYFALTAMSNRAAQELADATGLEVSTIHSFLGLAIKPNFQTGKQDLKETANWTIREKYIIFIDEAYMMDAKLLDKLRCSTIKCKIVFVGDDKQLEPVEDAESPIINLNVRTVELTIPVRTDNPHLQALNQLLRDNVAGAIAEQKGGPAHVWPALPHVPGVIDHITDQADLEALLNGPLALPDGGNLIVAFSNQRVNDYNNYLRSIRGQGRLFEVGETLISNDMYERGKFRIRNEQTVQIAKADSDVSWIKHGDLDIPTQYVEIVGYPDQKIPVVLDRDFMRDAIKWAASEAKAKRSDWERYFRLKQDFADFRPRDASTVHKAQGSSKNLVIVDLNNIGSCNFPVMTARMLYVGASRARLRVIFFGKLPAKYGGT